MLDFIQTHIISFKSLTVACDYDYSDISSMQPDVLGKLVFYQLFHLYILEHDMWPYVLVHAKHKTLHPLHLPTQWCSCHKHSAKKKNELVVVFHCRNINHTGGPNTIPSTTHIVTSLATGLSTSIFSDSMDELCPANVFVFVVQVHYDVHQLQVLQLDH